MSEPLTIEVVRLTDGDAVRKVLALADDPACQRLNHLQVNYFVGDQLSLTREQFNENQELEALKSLEGRSIRGIYLRENPNHSKGIQYIRHITTSSNRTAPSPLFDYVDIYPGANNEAPLSKIEFAKLTEATQRAFRVVSSKDLGNLLGPDVEKHFAAREEALSRLEALASKILEGATQQRRELDSEYLEKTRQLEEEGKRQAAVFEEQQATRLQAITEREAQLDEKLKALDDRSSTHVRRELRQAISKALSDQSRLKLSTDTGKRRWAVIAAYLTLLALTGIPAAIFFVTGYGATFDPWIFGRQVALSLSFILTLSFFIRLLNDWAEKSAAEEQKLRQMEIDIDRASWLVELIFEFKSMKGEELPRDLLQQLSKNLFGVDQDLQHGTNAAQTLATALITSASGLKFNLPGGLGEVSFDGKGIKKLEKTPVDEA